MPKKNVYIIYAGARNFGGIETYLLELFGHSELNVCLISLGDWQLSDELTLGNKKVYVMGSWYRIFKNLKQINSLIGKKDLIVTQGLVGMFYLKALGTINRRPNIITVHGDYNYDYRGIKRIIVSLLMRYKKNSSDYIAVSNYLKNKTASIGVNEEKIKVIYNGVKDIGPRPKKASENIVIGSLGRLHWKKGYKNLIMAMNYLPHNLILKIWGEGEERNNLEKIIQLNNLQKRVVLMGFTKDIARTLSEIDIYVQPSLEEGFGITVAEAMYAAKPIVVTPAGSLPELIRDNKTGKISKDCTSKAIAEEIKELNIDGGLWLGEAARKDAISRFDIEKWVKETEEVYMQAMRD